MGFAFLGLVIGYIPVVYASFSRREIQISMLDARAGSPPSAVELLVRLAGSSDNPAIEQIVLDAVLRDWERWAAELLESHISYPVLSFFRSQHSNQSWLGALTTMLDVTSLVLTGIEGVHPGQARLTFAMARHAAVDLAQVVNARYDPQAPERLTGETFDSLRETLFAAGLKLRTSDEARQKLDRLRSMYEPYVHSTGQNLMLSLPPWKHPEKMRDNWQAGPWDRAIQAKGWLCWGRSPGGRKASRTISSGRPAATGVLTSLLRLSLQDEYGMKNIGENVVRIEAEALRALADRIGGPMAAAFQRAVDLMFCCAGRVVVTGMGKSGLIARKIAATLSSTGTPACICIRWRRCTGIWGWWCAGMWCWRSRLPVRRKRFWLAGDDQAAAGAADCDDGG
jgi:hypothetical protein